MTAVLLLLIAVQITPELREHINAGLKAKSAGDLTTAIREFQQVAAMAPDLAAAHVNLGAVYSAHHDYPDAIASLRRALALDPNLPGAQGMLGTALLAQGYAAESVEHLEKGQADDLLGVALLETGRAREAIDHLEAALIKRPDDPDLLFYLSAAHADLSKKLFEKLRAQDPNSPRAHQILAQALVTEGKRDAAVEHFRAALKARPDLRDVHYSLGDLFLEAGDYEKAEEEFRQETQLTPGSAAAAYKLGCVLAQRGQTALAIDELRRANTIQPDMPETLLELGKTMNAAGDAKGAEPYLRQVIAAEQHTPLAEAAHFQLAQAYRKLGRTEDANVELQAFQELRAKRK